MITQKLKTFLKTAKKPLIVILGPTASGKTALSLKIAKEINGEIISTDSRQIYRGLEIGSDALPEDQQEGIPHHMIGIVGPDREYSLAEYKDDAEKIIDQIRKRKNIPILTGGTGLYISALVEDYDVPRVPPDKKLREKLIIIRIGIIIAPLNKIINNNNRTNNIISLGLIFFIRFHNKFIIIF